MSPLTARERIQQTAVLPAKTKAAVSPHATKVLDALAEVIAARPLANPFIN